MVDMVVQSHNKTERYRRMERKTILCNEMTEISNRTILSTFESQLCCERLSTVILELASYSRRAGVTDCADYRRSENVFPFDF